MRVMAKPARLLRYSDEYRVTLDGVTDLDGNAPPPTTALTFTTRAPPPLVAEDGFESVTDTTLGGAQVLSGAGAPTIEGARSLYIPPAASVARAGHANRAAAADSVRRHGPPLRLPDRQPGRRVRRLFRGRQCGRHDRDGDAGAGRRRRDDTGHDWRHAGPAGSADDRDDRPPRRRARRSRPRPPRRPGLQLWRARAAPVPGLIIDDLYADDDRCAGRTATSRSGSFRRRPWARRR